MTDYFILKARKFHGEADARMSVVMDDDGRHAACFSSREEAARKVEEMNSWRLPPSHQEYVRPRYTIRTRSTLPRWAYSFL